jgi:hypothetical protein
LPAESAPAGSQPSVPPDGGERLPPAPGGSDAPRHPPRSDADLEWFARYEEGQERTRELEATAPLQLLVFQLLVGNTALVGILSWLLLPAFRRWHVAFQLLLVAGTLGMSLLFVSSLLTKRARGKWLEVVGDGLYAHGVLTLSIWLWATISFAGLSAILVLQGIATTDPEHAIKDPVWDPALHFYLWKSLDSIPVLEIPQTIGWEPAFRFTDRVSPVLLLLYKIVVILPLIETGRLIWQRRHGGAEG